MKRTLAVALALAALGAGALALPRRSPAPSSKPEAPIQISARLVGDPHANAVCGLVVTATALAEGDVSVDVALPAGVTWVRGDRALAVPLKRGESRELRMDVLVADTQKREIAVRASVRHGTATLVRVVTVVLNDDGAAPAPKGTYKTDARGRAILEYRE